MHILTHIVALRIALFFIAKLHTHLIGFEPRTSPSTQKKCHLSQSSVAKIALNIQHQILMPLCVR